MSQTTLEGRRNASPEDSFAATSPSRLPAKKIVRPTIVSLEARDATDALPATAETRPAGHIAWLIEHYDAPRRLLWSSDDDGDSMLEAVAAVYRSRPRRETFIEWLWRNYPPRKQSEP
jgi:hypothetical protein